MCMFPEWRGSMTWMQQWWIFIGCLFRYAPPSPCCPFLTFFNTRTLQSCRNLLHEGRLSQQWDAWGFCCTNNPRFKAISNRLGDTVERPGWPDVVCIFLPSYLWLFWTSALPRKSHRENINSARNQMSQLCMSSGWIGYKFQAALSTFKHNLSCREVVKDSQHFKSDNCVKKSLRQGRVVHP